MPPGIVHQQLVKLEKIFVVKIPSAEVALDLRLPGQGEASAVLLLLLHLLLHLPGSMLEIQQQKVFF